MLAIMTQKDVVVAPSNPNSEKANLKAAKKIIIDTIYGSIAERDRIANVAG